ncbi:MAG: chemotaxis-specific protein-glutamate methyltransferase CheB [Phycisphaerales bacterium]|nr:chemotaxis-specific protein-glutamate methyltransferase CheB [Phycisphaerales bacterium]
MTKVLIVDDSAFMRKMISQMISSDPAFEIVGIARNGQDAIEQAQKLMPDIITLDIEMPVMDGLTALRTIKATCHAFNPHVLMCSSLTVAASDEALKALRLGASDVIAKDPSVVGQNDAGFKSELLSKLHALGSSKATRSARAVAAAPQRTEKPSVSESFEFDPASVDAVVIGSSTGGPPVLETILASLDATLRVPVIVAQHMPELFTRSLTKRLDNICGCGATLAENGVVIDRPGVYVALGGMHLKITRVAGKRAIARTIAEHPGSVYKPSVDLLYESAASLYGDRVLAIQLTGMGEDGAKGAQLIRKAGGHVLAQEASTCVVYGMPKAVVESGSASAVLNPKQIRGVLSTLCKQSGSVSPTTGLETHQSNRRLSA